MTGFIFVDFVAPLPSFLFFENLFYASIYAIIILLLLSKNFKSAYMIGISFSLFIAGRISRSIIATDGSLLGLWQEHLAISLFLLFIASISFYELIRLK
jgi:hypothetical protein